MNIPLYGFFGAGGAARAVLPMMRDGVVLPNINSLEPASNGLREVCLIETNPSKDYVDGYSVYSEDTFLGERARDHFCCIALGSPVDRRQVAARIGFTQIPTFSIFSTSSRIETTLPIGAGAIVCANSYISVNVQIGLSFFMNIGSILEHDCIIGNFVTFSPGVVCSGNVHIGDEVFVGAGSTIINGSSDQPLKIGNGVFIGAGTVVTNSIDSGQRVAGNPARFI